MTENDFKETEIGPIPEEWEVVSFTKCIDKAKINIGSVKKDAYLKYGKYPIIDQGQNKIAGYSNDFDSLYRGALPVIIFGDHTRFFKFVNFPFICGADGTKIIIPNPKLFSPNFLYYFLVNLKIPNRGYNRHYSILKEKFVVRPPPPEQNQIADILSTVQEAKEKTEDVINATKELKKSLMTHLFTYGPVPVSEAEQVNPKETEIGPIPEDWEVTKLGNLFEIQQGITLCREPSPGKLLRPFLRTSNVFWGKIDLSNLDIMYFSEKQIQSLTLKSKDLLICEGGDIGRTAIWNKQIAECCHQNHLHRLRVKNGLGAMPEFYMYWMQFGMLIRGLYSEEGNKTTIPNLSRSRLSNFLIPLPPLPEQKQIADMLSKVDSKIEAEENKAKALDALFKTLLENLMTGKIRVNSLGMSS